MYTTDDQKEELYEDEYYEDSRWNDRKSLIYKIIIIILCIIVLIWLVKALKNNSGTSNNNEVHVANVEKVRLAAEEFFFINGYKDKTSSVNVLRLKNSGLINGDIVDANNKVCSETNSRANLTKESDSYTMKVYLSCSTKDDEETFYYHINNLACLNCNGKTKMTGKEKVVAKTDNNNNNGGNNNVSDDIRNNNDEYDDYSCISWSNWTKNRVYDSSLTERSKTLVQGVKYGTTTTYGEWSEYSLVPIVGNNDLEMETKTITENYWSEAKTGTDIDTNNQNIKIISTETVNDGTKSCSGYMENGICYSNKVTVGNLSMADYVSGKYKILNKNCESVKTLLNSEGKYALTYVGCRYNEVIDMKKSGKSYTLYTYQVLEPKEVTYYRYRTVSTVNEPISYTDSKYEEEYLPSGYVKVEGSEETYYSYKLTECVK